MYECKILADSISDRGHRLTTFCVTFPRLVLAEVNTHRMLSRNSASSRAIPVKQAIAMVLADPFVPEAFVRNQPGMQADDVLDVRASMQSEQAWRKGIRESIAIAQALDDLEVHKALANRVLEPYKWHTAILTATDWSNFFALRTDINAQAEFRKIALMMQEAYDAHEPNRISNTSEWHLPLVTHDEILDESLSYPDPWIDWNLWVKVSIGRCARVSYLTHEGIRDLSADVALYDRLKTNGHLSPFEHVARPYTLKEWSAITLAQDPLRTVTGLIKHKRSLFEGLIKQLEYCGNLRGWHSARYDIPNQDDYSKQV